MTKTNEIELGTYKIYVYDAIDQSEDPMELLKRVDNLTEEEIENCGDEELWGITFVIDEPVTSEESLIKDLGFTTDLVTIDIDTELPGFFVYSKKTDHRVMAFMK